MRSARFTILGVVVAGVVALVAVGAAQRTSLAFTLGVVPVAPVVGLHGGQEVCQRPIDVPSGAGFDRVSLQLGTYHRAGPPVRVTVRDLGGRRLASGRIAGGYPDVAKQPTHMVRLDRGVAAPGRIAVCVRDDGSRRLALYGNSDAAARTSSARFGRRPTGADVSLVFERGSRSMLELVPTMFRHAALFRFPWMRGWMYGVLVALLLAAPLLLARAVSAAAAEREPPRL